MNDSIYNICYEFSDEIKYTDSGAILMLINQKYFDELKEKLSNYYCYIEIKRSLHIFYLLSIECEVF